MYIGGVGTRSGCGDGWEFLERDSVVSPEPYLFPNTRDNGCFSRLLGSTTMGSFIKKKKSSGSTARKVNNETFHSVTSAKQVNMKMLAGFFRLRLHDFRKNMILMKNSLKQTKPSGRKPAFQTELLFQLTTSALKTRKYIF